MYIKPKYIYLPKTLDSDHIISHCNRIQVNWKYHEVYLNQYLTSSGLRSIVILQTGYVYSSCIKSLSVNIPIAVSLCIVLISCNSCWKTRVKTKTSFELIYKKKFRFIQFMKISTLITVVKQSQISSHQ